eukprot:EG_transcript_2284
MSADEADAPHGGPFAHACAATLAPDLSAEAGTPRAGGSGAALAAALRRPAPYKLAAGEEPPMGLGDDVDAPLECALSSDDDSPSGSHHLHDPDTSLDTASSIPGTVFDAPASPAARPGTGRPEWACLSCTLLNTDGCPRCALCGTPRAGPTTTLAEYQLPPPAATVLVTTEEWSCPTCTFINPVVVASCCMCHTRRPEPDLSAEELPDASPAEPLPSHLDPSEYVTLQGESSSASSGPVVHEETVRSGSRHHSPQSVPSPGSSDRNPLTIPPRPDSPIHTSRSSPTLPDPPTPPNWLDVMDAARRELDGGGGGPSPFAGLREAMHRRVPSSSPSHSTYPPTAPPAPKPAPEGGKGKTLSSRLGLEKLLKRPKAKAEDASPSGPDAAQPGGSALPLAAPVGDAEAKAATPPDPSSKGFRSLGSLFSAKFSKFGQPTPPPAPKPAAGGSPASAPAPAPGVVPPAPLFTVRSDPAGGFVFNPLPGQPAQSSGAGGAADVPRLPASAPQWPGVLLAAQQGSLSSAGWGYANRSRRHEDDLRGHTPDVVEIVPDSAGSVTVHNSPWAAYRPPEVRHSRRGLTTTYLIGTIDSNAFRQTFGEAVHKYVRSSHRHWRSSPTTLDHSAAMWAALASGSEGDPSWRRILRPHYGLSDPEDPEWRDRHRSAREHEEELSMAARARELARHHLLERGREREREPAERDPEKERSLLKFMEEGGWGSGARASKLGRFLFFGGKDEEHHPEGDKKATSKRHSGGVGRDGAEEAKPGSARPGASSQPAASSSSSSSTGHHLGHPGHSPGGRALSPGGAGGQLAALCSSLGLRRLGGRDGGHGAVSVEDGGGVR